MPLFLCMQLFIFSFWAGHDCFYEQSQLVSLENYQPVSSAGVALESAKLNALSCCMNLTCKL